MYLRLFSVTQHLAMLCRACSNSHSMCVAFSARSLRRPTASYGQRCSTAHVHGEPVSAGHKVGKGKAAPQIALAVLQARVDSTCRTAQKKGLFHLSWLPAGHCLGRACPIAASLRLQTTGRPPSDFFGMLRPFESAFHSCWPWYALDVDPTLSSLASPLMFLCSGPEQPALIIMCVRDSSCIPGIKGSPCMAFALVLASTVIETWDHGECSCCVGAAFLLCVQGVVVNRCP